MPKSDLPTSLAEAALPVSLAREYVQSLVDYHWYRAAWLAEETGLLKRFFIAAEQAFPLFEVEMGEECAGLSAMPSGSNSPQLLVRYLTAAGRSLSASTLLADWLMPLCGSAEPRVASGAIVDCTNMALRRLTATVFALYPDNLPRCAAVVAALQKLFFFQGALLRDLFSNSESFTAGGFDETTGFPDHRTTLANLVELLNNRRNSRKPLAVLMVQVVFSHLVIDDSAYAASEVLFAQAADRLQRALRDTDIVGRFSRDEFLIVLPHVAGAGMAILAAGKVHKAMVEPFDVEARHAEARLSVGISLFPEHGEEAEALLHHAEIARDVARQTKADYTVYDKEFHRQNRLRQSLEASLRTALQENELEIYFQPQADLRSGKIVGAEALLRWHLADSGTVPPTQIISVAEDSGLISALTMWVFNSSLRHLSALLQAGIDITLSVNVTPSNLSDPELPDFIAQALSTWNVPPSKLTIELTETAMIGDSERTIDILHRLKRMGLALSVDDFGTGYSSLAYLKRMPLTELKVDQVFVSNMRTVREDERIVRSVIDLAHHFDLKVVAEGVEDPMTLEFLRALGCDSAQGYFISKPLPASEFAEWWKRCEGRLPRDSVA